VHQASAPLVLIKNTGFQQQATDLRQGIPADAFASPCCKSWSVNLFLFGL
jgi:hypothetical protein